jgi:threonine/homoserine/homoserine lactone efflux protein
MSDTLTFLPSLPVFLAFSAAGLILFITPGPDMSLWLAKTLTGGRRAGLAAAMGTNVGCVVHATLAALGISVLIQASPIAFNAMKIAGALYLLYLAVQMIRHGTTFALEPETAGTPAGTLAPFLSGIAINLSNPKVVIFFITFLPGFVSAADPHAGAKLLFLGLYFVAINIVLSAVLVVFADRFVATLRARPVVLRVIDWLFAGVFAVFAVTILRTQAR